MGDIYFITIALGALFYLDHATGKRKKGRRRRIIKRTVAVRERPSFVKKRRTVIKDKPFHIPNLLL